MKALLFKSSFLKLSLIVLLAVFIVTDDNFASAGWVAPTQPAPGGNVDAPINIGDTAQYREGALYIGGGDGDVNNDGILSITDVTTTSNFLTGKWTPTKEQFVEGDISGDGVLDKIDLQLAVDVVIKARTIEEAHFEGKKQASKALGRTPEGGIVIGGGGVKFADGSVQTTGLEQSVDASLCHAIDATNTQCKEGYYMKSPTKCCPFNSNMAAASGSWFKIDAVTIDVHNDLRGWGFSTIDANTKKSFVSSKKIVAMKARVSAVNNGFCYAYWGDGNMFVATQSEASAAAGCRNNVNNNVYPISTNASWDTGTPTCSAGSGTLTAVDMGGGPDGGTSYQCVIPAPAWTADNNGNINICLSDSGGGIALDSTRVGLNIPAGKTIYLQGANTDDDPGQGDIDCTLEVQYGN